MTPPSSKAVVVISSGGGRGGPPGPAAPCPPGGCACADTEPDQATTVSIANSPVVERSGCLLIVFVLPNCGRTEQSSRRRLHARACHAAPRWYTRRRAPARRSSRRGRKR